MTERATMRIMDLTETIQDDCSIIQKDLDDVKQLNVVNRQIKGDSPES